MIDLARMVSTWSMGHIASKLASRLSVVTPRGPGSNEFPMGWVGALAILVGFWLLFSVADYYVSGWWRLARRYRDAGQTDQGNVIKIGESSNGTIRLAISPAGLHIRVPRLLGILHPALIIPWNRIRHSEGWRLPMDDASHELDLDGEMVLYVDRKTFSKIAPYLGGGRGERRGV